MSGLRLDLIPEHMRQSVKNWVEFHEPAPSAMGGFLRAILTGDFPGAWARADTQNRFAMAGWAEMLPTLPDGSWGSVGALAAWYLEKHREEVSA